MGSEEKMLEILLQMQRDIAGLKNDMIGLKSGQARLEAGQCDLKADVAKLQSDMDEVKMNVKYIWEEIDRTSDQVHKHEAIIQKKIM